MLSNISTMTEKFMNIHELWPFIRPELMYDYEEDEGACPRNKKKLRIEGSDCLILSAESKQHTNAAGQYFSATPRM